MHLPEFQAKGSQAQSNDHCYLELEQSVAQLLALNLLWEKMLALLAVFTQL